MDSALGGSLRLREDQGTPGRTQGEDVVRTQWTQCTEETPAPVELYSVADGGHVWPGEVVYSGGGYATKGFSATDTIWDFFLNHPGATDGPTQK